MARLDTLLCDLGNVLAPFDLSRCARALAPKTGREPEVLLAQLRGPEFFALEAGELTPAEFFSVLQARLGLSLDLEDWFAAWRDIFTLDQAMVALVERLAPRYPTYLWSNGNPVHMEFLRPQLPVLQRFRGLHLSYELKAIKPDPRFFERAIDRGGLVPERCVFVDDVEANLAGARALGIHTVLHRSAAQTAEALARLGLDVS
jgi:putative hydrolase of the HAD superfamily